jgi:hypothetical protein
MKMTFFQNKIYFYLKLFIYNFNLSKNKSFKERLDFSLDQLIFNIYNDIKNLNYLIFFFTAGIIYIYSEDKNIIYMYISCFLFSISLFIKLVFLLKNLINMKFFALSYPVTYYLIKYALFSLLFINMLILIQLNEKLWVLIITYIKNYILKIKIFDKLSNMKISWDYDSGKIPKNPKNPKKFSFLSFYKKTKRKKEAWSLKRKLLKIQGKKGRRGEIERIEVTTWTHRKPKMDIEIHNKSNPTIFDQLERVKKVHQGTGNQIKAFNNIIKNVDENKENFYPNESTSLFKDYVILLKELKNNLKHMEENLKKSSKK